ncbi:unnamed protein product [Brassicogethes aeneus]|uniref:Uncharacterized protein n=1 Tax=Brassicogethes aeneus TaxID=1431903 RepID=A0A9P0FNK0_BRAAE|nr:unnamed protein product [Brassicogethes aeneus]
MSLDEKGYENEAFVTMLEDYKIILDKRMTPAIKSAKDKALKELAEIYNNNAKPNLDIKQGSHCTSRDDADRFNDEKDVTPSGDDNESIKKLQKTLLPKQINTALAQGKAAKVTTFKHLIYLKNKNLSTG